MWIGKQSLKRITYGIMVEEILLNRVLGVKDQCLTEHDHLTPWNSPPSEANGSLASREISHILQKLKVHYCVHKSHPPSSVMSQINPVCAPPHLTYCRSILILSFRLCVGLPKWFPSLKSPHPNPVCTYTISHTFHMLSQSCSWFDHMNIIWCGEHIMKLHVK